MSAIEKVWVIKNHQGLTIQSVGAPVNDTDVATKVSAQAQADAAELAATTAAALDATTKAGAAQAAAILAAASDATTKAGAAQAAAIAAAALDATTKASGAVTISNAYADGLITTLVGTAPTTLDTIQEIAAAITSDATATGAIVTA